MRRSMASRGGWLLAGLLLTGPSRLSAAQLPPDARAMLTEAYPKERQAVVNVLKRLYPGSADEIDTLVRWIADEKKLQVEQLGLIQGLRGEVSIGGYYSTGNTKERGASGTIAVRHEGKRWVNAFDVEADIKTEDGIKTTERAAANYIARRNFEGSRWFAAAGLRYERAPFAGLSRRFGQFIAPGYQLLSSEHVKWDVLAGPGARETRYVDG